jgi:Flp pilus assembly protein protease CpaA
LIKFLLKGLALFVHDIELVKIFSAAPLLATVPVACVRDIMIRKVPKNIVAQILVLGVVMRIVSAFLIPITPMDFVWSMIYPFVLLYVLMRGWKLSLIGGGDVKLWFAVAFLVPPTLPQQVVFTLGVLIFGGFLSCYYLWLRRGRKAAGGGPIFLRPALRQAWLLSRMHRVERRRALRGTGIPYAVAISLSALTTVILFPVIHLGWAGI